LESLEKSKEKLVPLFKTCNQSLQYYENVSRQGMKGRGELKTICTADLKRICYATSTTPLE